MLKAASLLSAAIVLGLSGNGYAFDLQVPVQCEFGVNCWIQQYADHDPTAGATDYTCSGETYDGHDGTDFRVLNITSDVEVVAGATGTVRAIRDGVDDRLATTPEALTAVSKVECGNGVVIAHDGGYETQYCHMKKGSVVVKVGDKVVAGTALGKVGYSGAAAFPHLHLSVRHTGEKLDPFSSPLAQDCHAAPQSLWSPEAAKALAYQPASLMELSWAKGPVSPEALDQASPANENPALSWPALVGYARLINLKKGDAVALTALGPAGEIAANSTVLDHDKAQYVLFAGKKIHPDWPAGNYLEKIEVKRDGKIILSRENSVALK